MLYGLEYFLWQYVGLNWLKMWIYAIVCSSLPFLLLLSLQVLTIFRNGFLKIFWDLYQSLGYMESRTQMAELDYRKLMKEWVCLIMLCFLDACELFILWHGSTEIVTIWWNVFSLEMSNNATCYPEVEETHPYLNPSSLLTFGFHTHVFLLAGDLG